ncbi:MAG: integrase [Bordetella sp. SCN 67-23]|nr:MAG: integrase [Bordetella sp. SCN 67-23]OYW62811.1 MAG: integrase [Hydrogenophilales bacterium 12-64-13]OYZ03933.1 MAG: integrase [Hydrogenophilales bacterium 16-64-46]
MARAGIYKSEVLRARTKLLAQGIHPSIDAVRAELGNTGSKSTIHRYLKEIEEEEGGAAGTKIAVSEAIQDLVGRLAGRLHEESDARIAEAAAKHSALIAQRTETIAALEKEAEAFRLQLERSQLALSEEQARHEQTAASLRAEALERARLAQQALDLQDRLKAEESHRQSLEEKHQHARESLEHFRQSVKDQREQEQRQHEQQVQYLQGEVRTLTQTLAKKQHEAIHAQQENGRLVNELSHAQSNLHQTQTELRTLKGIKDQFTSSERHAEELGRRVVEQEVLIKDLTAAQANLDTKVATLTGQNRQLEVELASARSSAATQEQITEKIEALLAMAAPSGMEEQIKPRATKSVPKQDQKTLFKT